MSDRKSKRAKVEEDPALKAQRKAEKQALLASMAPRYETFFQVSSMTMRITCVHRFFACRRQHTVYFLYTYMLSTLEDWK